jgi:hypothetical protein
MRYPLDSMTQRPGVCRTFAILCLVSSIADIAAAGQQGAAIPSGSPTPHRFFDRTNIALTVIESGALLADGIYTQRGLSRYPETSREVDPLARPFVAGGWPGQIAGGALVVSADVGLRYLLHRKKRHRLERLVPLILIVYGTAGAIHNARELRRAEDNRY